MKLLFDQNLPPRLASTLSDLYPDSVHVLHVGLDQAPDPEVRAYAQQNDLSIVTKDADFGEVGLLRGFPPKIIWIRRGNCTTKIIEQILRDSYSVIDAFEKDRSIGVLVLF